MLQSIINKFWISRIVKAYFWLYEQDKIKVIDTDIWERALEPILTDDATPSFAEELLQTLRPKTEYYYVKSLSQLRIAITTNSFVSKGIVFLVNDKPVFEGQVYTGIGGIKCNRFNYGSWCNDFWYTYKTELKRWNIAEKARQKALFSPLDE